MTPLSKEGPAHTGRGKEVKKTRLLKKIGKAIAVQFLVLILGLAALDIYLIIKPEIQAKRKIDGIDEIACGIKELTV